MSSSAKEINFENLTLREALTKAQNNNKLIYIDCYTSWCGPCQVMDKEVFTNKEVAIFFNANFINLKKDMEIGEGQIIRKGYNIKAFPTALFINSKGELMHVFVGGLNAENFISEGKKAIKSNTLPKSIGNQ